MKRVLLVVVVVLLLLGIGLWWSLTPPEPLPLPPRGAEIAGVTVVQPGEGRLAGQRIVVEGSRIAEIAPVAAPGAVQAAKAAPGDAAGERAASGSAGEFAGHYALPGLMDMHVHFPMSPSLGGTELWAFLFLYHGVTTVRDAGDPDGTATEPARRGVAEGRFPGPRIFACGPFLDGPEPLWANSRVLRTAADARAAVAELVDADLDCAKAYTNLRPEPLAALREAAHAAGLPVIGHVPLRVPFEQARLDDVQHLTGVLPDVDPEEGFPASLAHWRDFPEARGRFVTGISLAYDIAHTPTLVVLDRLGALRDYDALRREPDAQLLPRFYRDVVWSPSQGLPFLRGLGEDDWANFDAALAGSEKLVGAMYAAGVRIHAGTDTQVPFLVPGAALHRELRLLADAGLGPEGALAAATTVPGASLDEPGLGRLEPGAPADIAIFREDPTRDLAALDTLVAVVADGRLYRRADMDRQLERYRAHHRNPVFDAVSTALARQVMKRIYAGEPEPTPAQGRAAED